MHFDVTLTSHLFKDHQNFSAERLHHTILQLNVSMQRPHGEEISVAEHLNPQYEFIDCDNGKEQVDIALLSDKADESLLLRTWHCFTSSYRPSIFSHHL